MLQLKLAIQRYIQKQMQPFLHLLYYLPKTKTHANTTIIKHTKKCKVVSTVGVLVRFLHTIGTYIRVPFYYKIIESVCVSVSVRKPQLITRKLFWTPVAVVNHDL